MESSTGSSVSIRVAGALSGAVYLDSLEVTVHALRSEVARLMGVCAWDLLRSISEAEGWGGSGQRGPDE